MVVAMLSGAFSRLTLSRAELRPPTCSHAPLQAPQMAWRRNGISAAQRLCAAKPLLQAERADAEVVTCKLKLKTRKAAVKRYKVTGTGKVMVRKPGKQHINEKKRPNRLSRLGKTMQVLFMKVASTNLDNVIGCLPNHDIKKSTKVYIAPVAKADPAAEAE